MNKGIRWVMCDSCKDVHQAGQRTVVPLPGCRGVSSTACPACGHLVQAPTATIPREPELPLEPPAP